MKIKLLAIISVLLLTSQSSWCLTESSVSALNQIFVNASGADDEKLPSLSINQEKALDRLINSRHEDSVVVVRGRYVPLYYNLDGHSIPDNRSYYSKNKKEIREEVAREIREGSLQYKDGFSYGWHLIAGAPTSYFRAILLAPLGLLLGIATCIAGADGWV